MNLLRSFVESPITEIIGWVLLHSLWQIALIGLLMKLTLDVSAEASSIRRHRWAIVLFMLTHLATSPVLAETTPRQCSSPGSCDPQQAVTAITESWDNRAPTAVQESSPSAEPDDTAPSDDTWSVQGTITNPQGEPLPGVSVRVATGMASLQVTGEAVTDTQGTYRVSFAPGFRVQSEGEDHVGVQAATVFASLDGYSEANLCRQGDRLMAIRMPEGDTAWGKLGDVRKKMILRGRPVTIDFVLIPAAGIAGYLVNEQGNSLQRVSLSLTGPELPPSSSVYRQVYTDMRGRFQLPNVPTGKTWNFEAYSRHIGTTLSPDFTLEKPEDQTWLMTLDTSTDPHALRFKLLSQVESAALESKLGSAPVIVPGQTLGQAEWHDVNWGKSSNGLQAAWRMNSHLLQAGDRVACELLIRNVSPDVIQFESPRGRQGDKMRIWSDDSDVRAPRVVAIETRHFPWNLYVLQPGESISIDCGTLAITQPDQAWDACSEGWDQADGSQSFVSYHAAMQPGNYRLRLKVRLPNHWAETDSWKGSLTTGEVRFQVE